MCVVMVWGVWIFAAAGIIRITVREMLGDIDSLFHIPYPVKPVMSNRGFHRCSARPSLASCSHGAT